MASIKRINFTDGFSSEVTPAETIVNDAAKHLQYANDAAYVTANGAAVNGAIYYNTTTDKTREYISGAWRDQENASSHTNTPAGNIAATTVQGAIDELDTEKLDKTGGTISGNLVVSGDLDVNGTTTTINTANLDITDKNININNSGNDATSEGAGINVERTGTDGSIVYEDALASKWKAGAVGSEIELANVSSTQTFTNKTLTSPDINNADIDGGTASNSQRIVLPKDTTTNLDGLTDTQALIAYDTDLDLPVFNTGAGWTAIGTGGGGGLDVFDTEDFEDAGFTVNASGNNAAFLGGGTIDGAFSLNTSTPISADQSLRYTAGASSTNDYGEFKTIDLDLKQRAQDIKVRFSADMSGFANDVTFVCYDKTNAAILSSSLDLLIASADRTFYEFSFYVPSNCAQISFGIHMVAGATNTETIDIDDVEWSTNPFVYKDIIETHTIRLHTSNGFGSSSTKIRRFTTTVEDSGDTDLISYVDSATLGATFTILKDGIYDISFNDNTGSNTWLGISLNSTQLTTNIYDITAADRLCMAGHTAVASQSIPVSWSGRLQAGDVIRPHTEGNASVGTAARTNFTITGTADTEHVITPAKAGSETAVYDAFAGYGSTNNKIPYFTNERINTVSNLGTIANDSTDGWSFTASVPCIVVMSYGDNYNTSGAIGISKNSSELTTSITTITAADRVAYTGVSNTNFPDATSFNGAMAIGDVIRPHKDGQAIGTAARANLTITVYPEEASFLAAVPVQKVAYIKDVQTSGTNGGGSTANTVHKRVLNTLSGDTDFISLASDEFTLSAGEYTIRAEAPFYKGNIGQLFVHDGSSYILDGQSSHAGAADVTQATSTVMGRISIASSTTFTIEHWIQAAQASNGLGIASDVHASNPQSGEVYTQVEIVKLR